MKSYKKYDKKIIQGRWWKINNKIKKNISAKYDRKKDWVMDPKGYFLIKIDRENNLIRVGYCIFSKPNNDPIHDMIAEITGKTAIEIVNTLIKNGFISTRSLVFFLSNFISLTNLIILNFFKSFSFKFLIFLFTLFILFRSKSWKHTGILFFIK